MAGTGTEMEKEIAWTRPHLLGIADLERREIELLLETAESFEEVARRPIKKVPTLRGRTVLNLFFEASTRTRSSFELAEKRLSADALNFSGSGSALSKGETLIDTARNLEAMSPDLVIVRHRHPGVPHLLAERIDAGIINAGDGAHEHPSQALLDAYTILRHKKTLSGLTVAIVGDIAHSRVVRSNIHLLRKMGSTVRVAGPRTLMPLHMDAMDVEVHHDVESAVEEADVVMMLRVQLERHRRAFFPSVREYFRLFGLTRERLRRAKDDVIVMHPGPMNRGVEIDSEVADDPELSVILEQVANGVAVRMAILYLLMAVRGGST